jgi:hypothetical protein
VDCIHLVPARAGVAGWRPPAPAPTLAQLVATAERL